MSRTVKPIWTGLNLNYPPLHGVVKFKASECPNGPIALSVGIVLPTGKTSGAMLCWHDAASFVVKAAAMEPQMRADLLAALNALETTNG